MLLTLLLNDKIFMDYLFQGTRAVRARKMIDGDQTMPAFIFLYEENNTLSQPFSYNEEEKRRNLIMEAKVLADLINYLEVNLSNLDCITFVRWFDNNLLKWVEDLKFCFENFDLNWNVEINQNLQNLITNCVENERNYDILNDYKKQITRELKIAEKSRKSQVIERVKQGFRQLIENISKTQSFTWFESHKEQLYDLKTGLSNLLYNQEKAKFEEIWEALDMLNSFDHEYKNINFERFNLAITSLDVKLEKELKAGIISRLRIMASGKLDQLSEKINAIEEQIKSQMQEFFNINVQVESLDKNRGFIEKIKSWINQHPFLSAIIGGSIGLALMVTGVGAIVATSLVAVEAAAIVGVAIGAGAISSAAVTAVAVVKSRKKDRLIAMLRQEQEIIEQRQLQDIERLKRYNQQVEIYNVKIAVFDKELSCFNEKLQRLKMAKISLEERKLALKIKYAEDQAKRQSQEALSKEQEAMDEVAALEKKLVEAKQRAAVAQCEKQITEIDKSLKQLNFEITATEYAIKKQYTEQLQLTCQFVSEVGDNPEFTGTGMSYFELQKSLIDELKLLDTQIKSQEMLEQASFQTVIESLPGYKNVCLALESEGRLNRTQAQQALESLARSRYSLHRAIEEGNLTEQIYIDNHDYNRLYKIG